MSLGYEELRRLASDVIPPLINSAHKGQAGRIGVIGGSLEYTGAPYFSGISALKSGADLVHVFCHREAGVPIKGYSPELMVHPVLDASDPLGEIEDQLGRLHSLVAGPGLGRRPGTFATLGHILQAARDRKLLLVLDADALFYLNENWDTLRPGTDTILTPNRVEFARLYRSVLQSDLRAENVEPSHIQRLAKKLGVTILCKGETDYIAYGEIIEACAVPGSPRRCGGQGDILSGLSAVFLYWAYGTAAVNGDALSGGAPRIPPAVLAGWAASALTRIAANKGFEAHGRSTLTTDIIQFIPDAFKQLFPEKVRE